MSGLCRSLGIGDGMRSPNGHGAHAPDRGSRDERERNKGGESNEGIRIPLLNLAIYRFESQPKGSDS
jgi:hypothetical protein